MIEEKDKVRIKIEDVLKSYPAGLTISEIMQKVDFSRHTVLARLHALVGEGKIGIRKINMAKLHFWKTGAKKEEWNIGQEPVTVTPITEEHIRIKEGPRKIEEQGINLEKVREEIGKRIEKGEIKEEHAGIFEQRAHVEHISKAELKPRKKVREYVKTGILGFDELFEKGIPKSSTLLVAGGAGSGKTVFCLQTVANKCANGEKCLYMSFEESEERLKEHMNDFGWDADKYEKEGLLRIHRFNPFDITTHVDALLAKAKGELVIEIKPVILPQDFEPDWVVVDSLTAIASAFTGREDSYRIYIEQLFRFFESIAATTLMVTETESVPKIYSKTGVEEFLADGVIVLYNIKRGNIREKALEVLKMRGAGHETKIVAFEITDDEGIVVYPQQVVYGGIEGD